MAISKKKLFIITAISTAVTTSYIVSKIPGKAPNEDEGEIEHKHTDIGFDWGFIDHSEDALDCVKRFKNEIKWGIQRFVRGFDDTVLSDFDSYMDKLMAENLQWRIKHKHNDPALKNWVETDCDEMFDEALKGNNSPEFEPQRVMT